MRVIALLIAVVSLLRAQKGAVEGVVLNSVTHAPIPGVEVTLNEVFKTATDAVGAFRFLDLPAGSYTPDFNKRGFLTPRSTRERAFRIAPTGEPTQLRIELIPIPKIRGRVTDGEGRPIRGSFVELMQSRGGSGIILRTDPDGTFELTGAAPGNYFLRAVTPMTGIEPTKSPDGEPLAWVPTYYPNGLDRSQASSIALRPGDVLDGYVIRLRALPTVHIRGTVREPAGRPAAGASVRASAPNWSISRDAKEATAAADGTFDLPAILPGEWLITANAGAGAILQGFATVTASRTDIENLEVRLSAPFTVSATIERAGRQIVSVVLERVLNGMTSYPVGRQDPEGAVQIKDVYPGKYQPRMFPVPDGQYLDSVRFGERDVTGQTLDLMDGSVPLRIIYKSNGGTVRGQLEDAAGATVVLIPQNEAYVRLQSYQAACDATGSFQISALRPGAYSAYAFDTVADHNALSDVTFIRSIATRGKSVQVEAAQTTVVDGLRVMPWPEF